MNKADVLRTVQEMAQKGQPQAAVQQLAQVLRAYPSDPDLNEQMGLLLLGAPGAIEAATQHLHRAVQLAPAVAEFHSNYATALSMRVRHAEAIQEFRRAIALKPIAFAPHMGLSSALLASLDFDGALLAAKEAAAIDPSRVEAWLNMAAALLRSGRSAEAMATFDAALRRFPDHPVLLSSRFIHLQHRPGCTPERLRAEHEHFGQLLSRSLPPPEPFTNSRDPERTLRIAYLSPDFREHALSHFIRPILGAHDAAQFQVYAYSAVRAPDAVTAEFRAMIPNWRDVATMNDVALAAQARADQIDLMIDLAGHAPGTRLISMARRLAPVQASYLGYPATTGIPAIDYRIVDGVIAPPGAESFSTERLIRLDGCSRCYGPPADAPDVSPLPSAESGRITFGSFNSVQKISENAVRAWSGILKQIEGSRLLLKTPFMDSPSTRRHLTTAFTFQGIGAERLEFLGRIAGAAPHLAACARADIALDSIPYTGAATTCECLWMGVPVVTLSGPTDAARTGASLLAAAGLPDLIADDEAGYVSKAVTLARDGSRLRELRSGLREQLRASPLCDGPAFTRKLERAYREMWRTWCTG